MQRNFSEIQKCKGGDNPNILKNQDMEIDMSNVEFNFNWKEEVDRIREEMFNAEKRNGWWRD